MFRNYFKTAWRNLINNKVYSGLNILGLAAGMAVTLLIGLWVYTQYSFDRFLPGYKQLYQVKLNGRVNGDTLTFNSTSLVLADILRNDVPEIQNVAEAGWINPHGLLAGDKKLYSPGGIVPASFLKMFSYPLWRGDVNTIFKEPYSILLTRSTAKALFGKEDAINQTVRFDNADDLKVTGILEDLPFNSSFQFNYLVNFAYFEKANKDVQQDRIGGWYQNNYPMYVQLKPGVSSRQAEARIRDIPQKHDPKVNYTLTLQPMEHWHLYGVYKNGKEVGGFIEYTRLFCIIGVLILVIACINFINLSTARSEKRAREVGVRKAIGGRRSQLILQFMTESLLITLIAFGFALLLVQLVLPSFIQLAGPMSIPYGKAAFWYLMAGMIVFTGVLAGSRPAFYLSSFRTIQILKGALRHGRGSTLSRKTLVVMQFSCSVALIISTVIVYRQLQYTKGRDTGYDLDRLMVTGMNADLLKNYDALKNELLQSGLVTDVTKSSSPATDVYWHTGVDKWPGQRAGETINIGSIGIGNDYFRTMGMRLTAGMGFAGNIGADTSGVVFNETAIRQMRIKEPINQVIQLFGQPLHIVGVVKDPQMESPFARGIPLMFLSDAKWAMAQNVIYRLRPGVGTQDAIARLTRVFNKYNPAFPFTYSFADDTYAAKFVAETFISKLAGLFSILAIFISCLGLFGLAAYTAEQRTKEIGVRKVLGASVAQLWVMLSKDFVLLVFISCLIASPIALYFLHNWLLGYEYRIGIGPDVFILSAIIALVITLATVSFQAIGAALANPAKSLRSE